MFFIHQTPATLTAAAIALNALSALAQNLTFEADNFYRSNNVTLHPITFPNQLQMTIAGNLFIPDSLSRSPNTSAAAIVVGHPMGAVKEQAANLYATKLAEHGFITLALDISYWGSSSGTPRNTVLPDVYSESFSAAVDYLGTLGYISRERIGALGVCGSGSFALSAAKIDARIAAVATASMYDMGAANRDGIRHAVSDDARREQVVAASRQRWVEVDGGERQYVGGTPHEVTNETDAVGREFFDFYRTSRGEVTPMGSAPNLTTHPTLASNVRFHNFYPLSDLQMIAPRPVLFIAGDQAHSREFSEVAYQRAQEPKELLWVAGAGHVDLYDRVELIPFGRLAEFFQASLSSGNALL
ncbi:hypothetical protein E8E13_003246 [Curvularia kusanoi]|uniref:Dienelactone hydrolase domain-containing protein n=1 Tax=Curvularia kusanoi TaxID=90978 RepID=A0A9P4T5K1_CURKU|nr:hypothetical protein E8E13_003246 [Curvularia kusanoi]